MTKISNEAAYASENPISENDFVIGTDGDSLAKTTKSFNFGKIRAFVNAGLAPETGGTLAIGELVYNGVLTTPEQVVNQLSPNKTILPYEVFIVNVNGNKYICSIQDRVVGDTQPPTNANDYIPLITKSYKVYTAIISVNTDDVNFVQANVLENTIGSITVTGTNLGTFSLGLTGAFPLNKTFPTITCMVGGEDGSVVGNVGQSDKTIDNITFYTDNDDDTTEMYVEIKVYY